MAVYLVTGKLGSGKSLATVGKMRDYLNQGRMVATNLDLNLHNMIDMWSKKARVIRMPDKPVLEDLENLPTPYVGEYDENKTGLIVLDECGTWFNTRDYRDKTRQPLINKLLHIRKCGWDVIFIIQHIEMIDKQVREGLGEHVVTCQRADRLGIPFLTGFGKLFGLNIRPPKLHLALVRYGTSTLSPVVDRWLYNGSDLYNAYDTRQVFGINDCGLHCLLPPYMTHGQFITRGEHAKIQLQTKIKTFKRVAKRAKRSFFLIGAFLGFASSSFLATSENVTPIKSPDTFSNTSETKTHEQQINPLDYLAITAQIVKSDGIEYYFRDEKTGDIFSEYKDFRIVPNNECSAYFVKQKTVVEITCKARQGAEQPPQA